MNHEFVTVLPQTFPGASGQMTLKMLLQPNDRRYSKLPTCPGAGEFFAGPDK